MRIRSWHFPILLIVLVLILAHPVQAQIARLNFDNYGSSSNEAALWPAGTWHVRAFLLDSQDRIIGNSGGGFYFESSGGLMPLYVDVDMAGTATSRDKIRIFRSLGTLAPGDTSMEYVDLPCDDGAGGVLPRCDASEVSYIDDGQYQGSLSNNVFTNTGVVPPTITQCGLSSLERTGEYSKSGKNWPAGDWNVRAVLLDGEFPVGELTPGFDFNATGSNYPAGVTVSLFANGFPTDKIRIYRKLGPIFPGDPNLEYADVLCVAGSGNLEPLCQPFQTLPIDNKQGHLPNDAFVGTADVPPSARPGSATINVTGYAAASSLESWPYGIYELAAILLDRQGQPLGDLSSTTQFGSGGNIYPVAQIGTSIDAASSDRIRIFHTTGQFIPGQSYPYTDYFCNDGNGGVLPGCQAGQTVEIGYDELRWGAFDLVGEIPQYNTPTAVPPATSLSLRPTMSSFPNPADQRVTIRYALPRRGRVDLRVYDLAGRLVRQLSSETMDASEHVTVWDGRGKDGARVSAGVYMVRLSTPDGVATAKTLMLR